jgi:hypothetical protein
MANLTEKPKTIKTFSYVQDALNDKNINKDKIEKGFDRGIDYVDIRDKFTKEYKNIINDEGKLSKKYLKKLLYLVIAMIQLRNGSRISEAVIAFRLFLSDISKEFVLVQISKSQSIKFSKKENKYIETKPRFREMMFPNEWIDKEIFILFVEHYPMYIFNKLSENQDSYTEQELKTLEIINQSLRKNVLKYLLDNFDCNTHSLRYAFINYIINEQQIPLNIVAKFVGHKNTNMLVNYTQNKNMKQIFDLKI